MNYISDNFHIQNISKYRLYIKPDFGHDQVVVVDEDMSVLIFLDYNSSTPSQEVLRILGLPFASIHVVLAHQNLLWVPTEVKSKEIIEHLSLFFDGADPATILCKDIENLGVTALYQFDLLLYNRWKQIFPGANFIPEFEVVLQQSLQQIYDEDKVLGVHVDDGRVDLYLVEDSKFKFYKTFEITTTDDLSYHVLQLFQSFKISGSVEKILLSGADLNSDFAERLRLYTNTIENLKSKNSWFVVDELKSGMERVAVLLDSDLCV